METVLPEADSGVLPIALNRPDRLNAFRPALLQGLAAAMTLATAGDRRGTEGVAAFLGKRAPAFRSA